MLLNECQELLLGVTTTKGSFIKVMDQHNLYDVIIRSGQETGVRELDSVIVAAKTL